LHEELPDGAVFVVDARGGEDPFVYVEIVGARLDREAVRARWAEAREMPHRRMTSAASRTSVPSAARAQ
jgi:hypothetical protein